MDTCCRKLTHRLIPKLLLVLLTILVQVTRAQDIIEINPDIQLITLNDSTFVHVTWEDSPRYGRFPSNGMIVIRSGQALMIDTPMDNHKTELLHRYIQDSLKAELSSVIVCHYHADCLGGIPYLNEEGIPSMGNSMTARKCRELDIPLTTSVFTDSLTFNFNGEIIECLFPGGGHTFDNIVVWFPQTKILFGGCLVKAAASRSLGNTKDAEIDHWDKSVARLYKFYPDMETIIPGHGAIGGPELIKHTVNLVKRHKQ